MTGATTGAPVRMLSIHPLISVRKLLIFLHELDNIDKHRVLHVANLAGYSSVAFVPAGSQEAISLHTTQPQRITVTESDIHEAANAVELSLFERSGDCHDVTIVVSARLESPNAMSLVAVRNRDGVHRLAASTASSQAGLFVRPRHGVSFECGGSSFLKLFCRCRTCRRWK